MNEDQIVRENADLVHAIARRYLSWGVPFEDLMQAGFIGLLLAARSWREDGGANLRTYATARIKVHVRRAIGTDRAGKMKPPPRETSLDSDGADDGGLHEYFPCLGPSPEDRASSREEVREALGDLPPRTMGILHAHYVEEETFREIGNRMGLTHQRIKQVEQDAITAVRKRMKAA